MPEPSVRALARSDLPTDLQALCTQADERAIDTTHVQVLANHPDLLRWYYDQFYQRLLYNTAGDMKVERRYKELARLKLSKHHGCQVCNRGNEIETRAVGYSQAQIDNIGNPSPAYFSDAELAVLELCEQIVLQNQQGTLSPALHRRLRAHFDDAQILELGVFASILTGFSKFLFVFDLVPRDPQCPLPTRTLTQ
ncbi:MAG: carboxymuconolactone decarboxylase family protein [Steroidobacteraceae bacterium]